MGDIAIYLVVLHVSTAGISVEFRRVNFLCKFICSRNSNFSCIYLYRKIGSSSLSAHKWVKESKGVTALRGYIDSIIYKMGDIEC